MKKNTTASPVRFAVAGLGESGSQTVIFWKLFLMEMFEAEIDCFQDGRSLKAAARLWQGKLILFSNFPPDASNGFTYQDSKEFFTELLSLHEPFDLHIITCAGAKTLADREILNLSSTAHITIQRAWEWLDAINEFRSYVVRRLRASLRGSGQSLRPGPKGFDKIKRPKPTTEELERHLKNVEWCRDCDPLADKPSNPNVDVSSFRIWLKANRVRAARKYAELSGD